ncbi:N-acetylmuramoyl-L-alanine amidase family protein, partial [Listeria monocytogenes]|nr:N-acetylmuramoyl-L-alanine amidase family protein [Listeria monocytogenes]
MTTVNGVPFRQNLVSSSKYNIKAPNAMKAKKITIHNT